MNPPAPTRRSNTASTESRQELRPGKSLAAAICTALAILAVPAWYLVTYYRHSERSPSGSANDAIPPQDIANLEQVARTSPTIDHRLSLSLAYIQASQADRAIPVLDTIIAEDGGNAAAWNNRCVAKIMQKAYASAMEDCRNALRIMPGFQLAQNNLKWAEDESRKVLNPAAPAGQNALSSQNASDYLAEGLTFLNAGEYDRAIQAWQHVLAIDPRSALAANNIGTAYMFRKDPVTALSWFEKALAFDPTLQIAKNNLVWARSEIAKAPK